jgi:hypothetical protein
VILSLSKSTAEGLILTNSVSWTVNLLAAERAEGISVRIIKQSIMTKRNLAVLLSLVGVSISFFLC